MRPPPKDSRQYGVVVRVRHGHGVNPLAHAHDSAELLCAASLNQRITLAEGDPLPAHLVETIRRKALGHVLSLSPSKHPRVHYFCRFSTASRHTPARP